MKMNTEYHNKTKRYKIAVVGAGYVGLSIAVLLAQYHQVTILDINDERIALINNRQSPFEDSLIEKYLQEKELNLTATDNNQAAYKDAGFVIIAVPTNYCAERNTFDTSIVESVIQEIISANPDARIVIKSTVPLGYTESIRRKFKKTNILFSPEFLREGQALYDNLYPSRIIVSSDDGTAEEAHAFAEMLKQAALNPDVPTLFMHPTECEAVKLFSNTYLALRVAFFNELDTYAEAQGLSTPDIINGICADPRIGAHYNNPSFGYGGYCLPKDTKQILANYDGIPQELMSAVVASNDTRASYIASQILARAKALSNNPTIGIYRLTMKSDSDNFRESSVQKIIELLEKDVSNIIIFEPKLEDNSLYQGHKVINRLDNFLTKSHVIIANRYDASLDSVKDKVYTRDIFNRD